MRAVDKYAQQSGRSFITREEILKVGGTDRMIASRVQRGMWSKPHAGVYRLGPEPSVWLEKLDAAIVAAGPSAVVSHRAAYVLWGLDGIDALLVEITVPYGCAPVPSGVIRHRTRREMAREIVQGLPVTSVSRSLLDSARYLPVPVLVKGIDSALRRELTSLSRLWETARNQGGRGVPGSGKFRRALAHVDDSGRTGSPAEAAILLEMRRHGIPDSTPQWEVLAPSGRRYLVDFGWPNRAKGVEIDGLDAHSGSERLERDLIRQNDLMDAGVDLRRFTARRVRNDPAAVVEEIRQFLAIP